MCNSSYKWPLSDEDTYVEWDGSKCVVTPSLVRIQCESADAKYDIDKRECIIDENYCKLKGADWGYNSKIGRNDCMISQGQEIAEVIFGSTVVRGLKQVFDPKQYKPCAAGETDLSYSCSKQFCGTSKNSKDNDNYNIDAGLCYPKCKDRFRGVGPVCWEDCPSGYTDDGLTCRKSGYCPPGTDRDGALCYPQCDSGYKGVGPVCWENCPSGYTDTGALCSAGGDVYTKKTTKPTKGDCDSGQRDDGTSCWEDLKCETKDNGYYNYTWGGANTRCWDGGYAGWGRNDCYRTWIAKLDTQCSGCGCIKKTLKDRSTCPSGYSIDATGITCWENCKSGYTDDGLTCRKPIDTKTKKSYGRGVGKPDTTIISKNSYGRGIGLVPKLNFYFKKRDIPYGKADVGANAKAIGTAIADMIG
jgi:hypothetical protein